VATASSRRGSGEFDGGDGLLNLKIMMMRFRLPLLGAAFLALVLLALQTRQEPWAGFQRRGLDLRVKAADGRRPEGSSWSGSKRWHGWAARVAVVEPVQVTDTDGQRAS
jgi:hypothetical protein